MNQRPLRVALYARVSTRDKDQNPQVQLGPLRDYAHARGWTAAEYVDQAQAADLTRRTAWRQLLEDARRRRIDHILVWKLDRAFRSVLHCLSTLQTWQEQGVSFACLTQDIDTSSATGRLVLTIVAAVAEFERELIRERVKEGMAHARRQGKTLGRPTALSRPRVARAWPDVQAALQSGTITKREAARRLGVGSATLARLLGA